MDLCFSQAAQAELDEAFAYMEGEEPGLGYRFERKVKSEVMESICHNDLALGPCKQDFLN